MKTSAHSPQGLRTNDYDVETLAAAIEQFL
jgi:hypothetical protein